jgi:hypothetical protein
VTDFQSLIVTEHNSFNRPCQLARHHLQAKISTRPDDPGAEISHLGAALRHNAKNQMTR